MIQQLLASIMQLETLGASLEWVVVEPTTHNVFETCGLHSSNKVGQAYEVGCLLNPIYWRQDYISEVIRMLSSYAKSLGIEDIYTDIDHNNV